MAKLMTWASHGPFFPLPAAHDYCVIADTKMLSVARRGGEDPSILVNKLMATLQPPACTFLPAKQKIDGFNTCPLCSWDKDDQDTTLGLEGPIRTAKVSYSWFLVAQETRWVFAKGKTLLRHWGMSALPWHCLMLLLRPECRASL